MLIDATRLAVEKALDGTAMRHRAIANNLANVETPGYQREDVSFEEQLRSALDPSAGRQAMQEQVAGVAPEPTTDSAQPVRENGNNVDPDREMAILAKNTVQYEALLQSLNLRDGMLKMAIWEGRK